MRNSKVKLQLLSVAIVVVMVILACGPETAGRPTLDPNAVATAVQQTMIANTLAALNASQSGGQQSSGDQQQGQNQNQQAQPPTATFTPVPPTLTETPSLTPQPTNTFTPSVPLVSVSVNTNCRFGPGKGYELLGALLVGEQAEIVARDPSGYYWYIKNPDKGGFCWLWGNYATTIGNVAGLPVFTPPPTPTFTPTPTPEISYSVSFHEIEGCVGWELEFKFTNTGEVIFQSLSITVTDNDTAQTVAVNADKWIARNGCLEEGGFNDLDPGDTGYAVSGVLINDPAGHSIDATVKLCTENGQGGTCVTKNLSFTP